MPVPGGTTRNPVERSCAQRSNWYRSQIALVLLLDVVGEREARAEEVDLHRVVDHEVGRQQGVDLLRVAAEAGHRRAHRRDVHHGRHAGVVLEQDARAGRNGQLSRLVATRLPGGQRLDVRLLKRARERQVSEDVLEHDLDDVRHPIDVGEAGQGREPVDRRGGAVGEFQGCTSAKRVGFLHRVSPPSEHLVIYRNVYYSVPGAGVPGPSRSFPGRASLSYFAELMTTLVRTICREVLRYAAVVGLGWQRLA